MKSSATVGSQSIKENGILNSAKQEVEIPTDYCNCSIQLKKTKARNQKHSGRCWIEAALDELEYKYFIETGETLPALSSEFIAYYDLKLKVHIFLNRIYRTQELSVCDAEMNFWMCKPVQDAGQKAIFRKIIEEYGIIPESYMPKSVNYDDTRVLIAGLNQKLRFCAYQIRNNKAAVESLEHEVFRMIDTCLGELPQTISYNNSVLTPTEFYQKYIKKYMENEEISFVNCPSEQRLYNQNYKVKWLYSDTEEGSSITHYNISAKTFAAMAVCQLEEGLPVWIGADAEHFSDKEEGIFDTGLFDFETLFSTQLELEKGEALLYKDSAMTHAMLLCGVDIENGIIKRWCVKNSFGDKIGQDGYAYMSAQWFYRYVYQIVISKETAKKFLNTKEIENAPVTWLEPWDAMGCLA